MSLRLQVRPRRQRMNWSCWWEACAMILEYHHGTSYTFPWDLDMRFAPERTGRENGYEFSGEHVGLHQNDDGPGPYAPPSTWYQRGLPPNAHAILRMYQMTGMHPVEGPSTYTVSTLEGLLRRCGPFAFMGRWQGYPHVLV